jgi:hypothetical protein
LIGFRKPVVARVAYPGPTAGAPALTIGKTKCQSAVWEHREAGLGKGPTRTLRADAERLVVVVVPVFIPLFLEKKTVSLESCMGDLYTVGNSLVLWCT